MASGIRTKVTSRVDGIEAGLGGDAIQGHHSGFYRISDRIDRDRCQLRVFGVHSSVGAADIVADVVGRLIFPVHRDLGSG